MRNMIVPLGVAVTCSVVVAAIVVAVGRPVLLTSSPSAVTANTTITPAILTSGHAIVSKKPDLAVIGAGIHSHQPTPSAAQADPAGKAAELLTRIQSLPTADQAINTTGSWARPF